MDLKSKFYREYGEAKARLEALDRFNDLAEFKDIWGITRLVSTAVNDLATQFEIRNECDCCNRANVYALPYIEFQGIKIYALPFLISFAKRYKDGILSTDNWENQASHMNGTFMENLWAYIDTEEEKFNDEGFPDDGN